MTKTMYDIIKRQNGEAFAKAVRDFDSGIFDIPDLPQILKYAGRNPLSLIRFLSGLRVKQKSLKADTLDPFILLKRAGYDAFYADTLEKQNSIKPYFIEEEELCTFLDSSRYKKYYIIHAVKQKAQEIKRESFLGREERDDTYGTSVISIQILKTGGFIKITNRYNHTVPSCDNTFNSNPDNIIPGLTRALKHHFAVEFNVGSMNVPNGYVYQNGCLYQYHYERNNCFIGRDFYLKDGAVYPIDKDSQMMVDSFIFDLKKKKILNPSNEVSSLYDVLLEETKGAVWQVKKRVNHRVLYVDGQEVLSTKDGFLKTLFLRKTTEATFLAHHKHIEEIQGFSLKKLGPKSLSYCPKLSYVHLCVCEEIGANCFEGVSANIEAPVLNARGIYFMAGVGIDINKKKFISQGVIPFQLYEFLDKNMHAISKLSVDKLFNSFVVHADEKPFLYIKDDRLVGLCLPEKISVIESQVLMDIPYLREFSAPGVHLVEGGNFLRCSHLEKLELPNAKYIGYNCLSYCPELRELNLPKVEKLPVGVSLTNNSKLKQVYAPNLYGVALDFYQLPALERFDCEQGVYLRKAPSFVGKSQIFRQRFVFVKRDEHER